MLFFYFIWLMFRGFPKFEDDVQSCKMLTENIVGRGGDAYDLSLNFKFGRFEVWEVGHVLVGILNHLRVICHHFCCPMSLLWASSIHDQFGDIGIMRQLGFNYPVWSSLQTSQLREVEKLGLHRHKPGKAQSKFESADEYQWQERLRTCKKRKPRLMLT